MSTQVGSEPFNPLSVYFEEEIPFEMESGHCRHCGLPREGFEFGSDLGANLELMDIVINPPTSPGAHGKPSSFRNPRTTTDRCTGGVAKTCPTLPGLVEVAQVSGVGFEYIAGWSQPPGLIKSRSGKWIV